DNAPRTSDFLIARQGDARMVDPCLVEERLMPGDERRRMPAFVVVERENWKPVHQKGDAFPLTPAALLLRQLDREFDLHGNRLSAGDGMRQWNDKRRVV